MIKVACDKKITISTGQSRESKKWKNRKMLWSELLQRLAKPHRTLESEKEYANMNKSDRDRIKDIGGFVGGNITGGRRKKGAVTFRSLITLDVDYIEKGCDPWSLFTMLYDNAACVYSTHSHRVSNPRLRIVLPLDRDIDPEEYEPIARKIAGHLDIEIFDNTTFQPERLMYWPSTPLDGQYVFHHQDGPILSADQILNSYHDWKDVSQWPISAKAIDAVKRGITKQGDPMEKPGVIGAFNRAFSVEDAINAFLPTVYEKSDVEDRFTYLEGSTAGGLIVYEDKFAYSHHGTDPVSEKLCSAFDLVRIHLYGEQDNGVDEHTPINKRPSFIAMRELALKDKKVRKAVVKERIDRAAEAFAGIEMEEGGDGESIEGVEAEEGTDFTGGVDLLVDEDWLETLEVDKHGSVKSTIENCVVILNNDTRLKGVIAIDEFRNNMVRRKKFKWDKQERYLWSDTDEAQIRRYLQRKYGISGRGDIRDAIDIVGTENIFHPVRDYLDSLEWDGVSRLDTVLIDYMGAEDTPFVRAVTRKTLVAAVNRVMEPGCKFDYILMLQSVQGRKKSTFWKTLAGNWYNKNFTFSMIGKKEAIEQLQGSWINEVGELAGLNKAEDNAVKNFIDNTKDEMRPAYGRFKMEFLRQGIFVGSFNEDTPLRDQTGGRRYWPVKITGPKQWKKFEGLVDQFWAEAHMLYMAGEKIYLDEQLEAEANKIQEEFTEKDVRIPDLLRYLDMKVPENWASLDNWQRREFVQGDPMQLKGEKRRHKITIMEIWQELFGGSVKDITKRDSREINEMMRAAAQWEPARFGMDGSRERGYKRVRPLIPTSDVKKDASSALN